MFKTILGSAQVNLRENTEINKQPHLKFWLDWIKHWAVSYSLSFNKRNCNGSKKPSEMCLRNILITPKETTKKRLKFAKSWWPCMKNFQNWTKLDHTCIKPKYFASQLIIQVYIWHLLFVSLFIFECYWFFNKCSLAMWRDFLEIYLLIDFY